MYQIPEWTRIALPARLAVTTLVKRREQYAFFRKTPFAPNTVHIQLYFRSVTFSFGKKIGVFPIISRPYSLRKLVWLDENPKLEQDRSLGLLNCRSREYRRVHRCAVIAGRRDSFLILFHFFQALFSLVAWPFSLKIIWAPLVDALYLQSVGRRKSWLIPVQCLMGKLWLETPLPDKTFFHTQYNEYTPCVFKYVGQMFAPKTFFHLHSGPD